MELRLRIILVIVTAFSALLIIRTSKKAKMEIKDAVNWLIVCLVLLIIAIFPQIIFWITSLVGISVASNAVFALMIFALLCMVYYLNIRISRLSIQNRELIQRLALLEKKFREAAPNLDGEAGEK
jgi:hypothetical protein